MHLKDLRPNSKKLKRSSFEYDEQCVVVQWAQLHESKWHELKWLHASLNGVKLSILQAVKAKKSGCKKGIADLFLPKTNTEFCGLYIEMKSEKGKQTPKQKEFEAFVKSQHYKYCVCYSAVEAISEIKFYINIK